VRLQHRPDEQRRLASRSLPSLYRLGQARRGARGLLRLSGVRRRRLSPDAPGRGSRTSRAHRGGGRLSPWTGAADRQVGRHDRARLMPARPCLKCGTLIALGFYCVAHHPDRARNRTTPGRGGGSTIALFRAVVLNRAAGRCQWTNREGVRCSMTMQLEAHHVQPLVPRRHQQPEQRRGPMPTTPSLG
jgi:hypothetical protein